MNGKDKMPSRASVLKPGALASIISRVTEFIFFQGDSA